MSAIHNNSLFDNNSLQVVITNYPTEKTEWFTVPDFPHVKDSSTRQIPFSKTLYLYYNS